MSELKITVTSVTKMLIVGADRLDPITVFLEDITQGNGKITVSCFGKSWTAHWAAMGENTTVAEFFVNSHPQYIIGYFSPSLRAGQYSAEKTAIAAKRRVLELRREEELSFVEAREFFEDSACIEQEATIESLYQHNNKMLSILFGDDWWHCVEEEPNPDYKYLERIVKAVQDALKIRATGFECVDYEQKVRPDC